MRTSPPTPDTGFVLDRLRVRALNRALNRALDLDYARTRARARMLVQQLYVMKQQTLEIAGHLEAVDAPAPTTAEPAAARGEIIPTSRPAEHLVSLTMRLLPARHRSRYTEEFKAELHDLAQAKTTAAAQIAYALQQLGRVWRLREALLTPDRPRFHRLHRTACWMLATETRTWTPLTGLLLWGGAETTLDTGLGTAILTVIGGGAVCHAGVTWGRKRLDVQVRRRKTSEQPDSPAGS